MNTKKVKDYIYTGLGFPVKLYDVTLVKVNDEWHPKLDVKKIADTEIHNLITQKNRLTGNQIKFIRSYFKMSLRDFEKVVNESHTAIHKWELSANKQTKMDINIEIILRLFIYNFLYKSTKENKIKFYDNFIKIKNALYKHSEECVVC